MFSFFLLYVLTRELPVNLHSVLLQIATQSLTIGECNYFGSHNSDIRNDPVVSGVRMLMYGPACPCMYLEASVHSCSAGGHFFWNYDCNL